tara:strand:- start:21300 stop:22382 length:1083 start_codon:yes stop_codon:yes gene_type:complete
MPTSDRTVIQDNNITLYIEVRNTDGVLITPDAAPTVSIFDFDSDPRNGTTTDADASVLDAASTLVAQGIYSYVYTVAAAAHVGIWFDRWKITVDTEESVAIMQFEVTATPGSTDASVNIGTTALFNDNVVIITLSDGIAATDGSILSDGYQYYFTTEYSLLYSSIRRVRLRAGGYMSNVPDDTINLAIFEASKMANSITFGLKRDSIGLPISYQLSSGEIAPNYGGSLSNGPYLSLARVEYSTCMAIFYILSNSLGPTAKKKRLADFQVDYGDSSLSDFIDGLKKDCEDWEFVLNAAGYLNKGSSLPISTAIRGSMHPDHPRTGRLMSRNNKSSAANTKVRPGVGRSWQHTYDAYWRSKG